MAFMIDIKFMVMVFLLFVYKNIFVHSIFEHVYMNTYEPLAYYKYIKED